MKMVKVVKDSDKIETEDASQPGELSYQEACELFDACMDLMYPDLLRHGVSPSQEVRYGRQGKRKVIVYKKDNGTLNEIHESEIYRQFGGKPLEMEEEAIPGRYGKRGGVE